MDYKRAGGRIDVEVEIVFEIVHDSIDAFHCLPDLFGGTGD